WAAASSLALRFRAATFCLARRALTSAKTVSRLSVVASSGWGFLSPPRPGGARASRDRATAVRAATARRMTTSGVQRVGATLPRRYLRHRRRTRQNVSGAAPADGLGGDG